MTVTSTMQEEAGLDEGAITTAPVAPRIERCGSTPGGQLLLKCDEPAVIAVEVTGLPEPDVHWHVAGRRVRKTERYRAAATGRRHTLTVLRVTDELEKGVWVMASNAAGEDSCLITVRTYKVLSGIPNTFHDSVRNARQSAAMLTRGSTARAVERPFFLEAPDLGPASPTSPTSPTAWNREMEIRNRMRSVDDLMYYGRWKRESLRALRDKRRTDDSVNGGGSVSLNQSYSGASVLTATDDERRAAPSRRRRLRLRRRDAGSVVSAPVKRPISLDDSVGSAALDVDSMFRLFASSAATPVSAADVGIRSSRPVRLPPSGLPPSGRATSARRTSLRRRRRPMSSSATDVTNVSTDVASTSLDDVRMTSSTVDLEEATASAVVPATARPDARHSRPVRSQRRRRRTDQSPSRAAARDFADEAPVTATSAAPNNVANVNEPEALWELCGEKLGEVCRRILRTGVMDADNVTSPENKTEPDQFQVVQPSGVLERSPPCNEAPGSPLSEGKPAEGVFGSAAYNFSPVADDIPQLNQQTSQRRDVRCSDVENADIDVGGSVISRHDDVDESSGGHPTSLTVAADDAQDGVEAAAGRVPPSDDELDTKQFQTATASYSPERCRAGLEMDEAAVSDRSTTDLTPLAISESYAASDQRIDEQTSSLAERRLGAPDLDISAMLSPSIELRDILDTIYTLTGGGDDVDGDSATQSLPNDDDETPSPAPRENPATSGDENACPEDDRRQLRDDVDVGRAAAVPLDDDDDDDESLLDLDAEMYEYDLSPAAADLADALHLAIAEDDDFDVDIADYEYELDDDDVL